MPLKSVFQLLAGQKQAPPVPTPADVAEPRETAVQNPNIPEHPESTPLAAQIRNDWLFGNWAELAAIPLSTLEPEPERAELAVLIAAAHMQQATRATAQTLLKQARQWGAADSYITRTLTALAHQSLGAAQASQGSFDKALQTYQQAVLLGGSSAYLQQAIQQAHAQTQEYTQQPNQPHAQAKQGPGADLTPALAQLQHLQTTLESSSEATQASFKQQADDLIRVRKFLEAAIKKEVTNVGKQTQAFVAIQNYLTTGHLPAVSTEFNSWPISPDFSLYLINLLETEHYDLVIEFGSGYSTELIARVLQNQNNKHPDLSSTLQVAFEHLEPYYKKTRSQLQVAGLQLHVQLLHAPLAPWQGEEDKEYPYYTASMVVQSLEQLNLKPDAKILVLVDGPPAATGPHARYPAFPLVNAVFPRQAVHYLMDDYARDDEKEIVKLWQACLTTHNRTFTLHETKLEKDACLIRVDAL